jgi:glycosyltransferase involved in cell wall biosynthesis
VSGSAAVVRGRVGLQQRVLPSYRAEFFDRLAARCPDELSVFAGEPREGESIGPAPRLDAAHWERGENVHVLAGPAYLCHQPGLGAWLERWDPEVLILEANPRYPANWEAARWMQKKGRRVLGWGLGVGRSLIARRFWRPFLRRFDGVIAYSRRGASQFASAGVPEPRIWIAPNAMARRPAHLPPRKPRREGKPRLIFVGRLQPRKRIDVLLAAGARLRPSPEVWIVGDGPDRSRLEAVASDRSVSARFYGDVRGQELEGLLDEADLFVLPGTGGLAVQQAMARGLPVIVAEGDGTQEDMVTQDNGWLVRPGDVGSLTATLRVALARPERLAGMGRASHRLVVERFNLDTMVDVFVAALRGDEGPV